MQCGEAKMPESYCTIRGYSLLTCLNAAKSVAKSLEAETTGGSDSIQGTVRHHRHNFNYQVLGCLNESCYFAISEILADCIDCFFIHRLCCRCANRGTCQARSCQRR